MVDQLGSLVFNLITLILNLITSTLIDFTDAGITQNLVGFIYEVLIFMITYIVRHPELISGYFQQERC